MYFLFLKTLCLLRIQAFIKLLHILSETFACLFENILWYGDGTNDVFDRISLVVFFFKISAAVRIKLGWDKARGIKFI